MGTVSPIRAPRLTDRLLAADLPVAIDALNAEIEYLQDRLHDDDVASLAPVLRERFTERLSSLTRSRDWLAGKVAAETHHRTED